MPVLHHTHPLVLELGARIALDQERSRALWVAETFGVPMPVLYRSVHLMEVIRDAGGDPWETVNAHYVLDGKMRGDVLIDEESPDVSEVRERVLREYGITF